MISPRELACAMASQLLLSLAIHLAGQAVRGGEWKHAFRASACATFSALFFLGFLRAP